MFGVSFFEFLLIIVIAFFIMGPKDAMIMIDKTAKFLKSARMYMAKIKAEIEDEVGLNDKNIGEMTGLDGKKHKIYDLAEIDRMKDVVNNDIGDVPMDEGIRTGKKFK